MILNIVWGISVFLFDLIMTINYYKKAEDTRSTQNIFFFGMWSCILGIAFVTLLTAFIPVTGGS